MMTLKSLTLAPNTCYYSHLLSSLNYKQVNAVLLSINHWASSVCLYKQKNSTTALLPLLLSVLCINNNHKYGLLTKCTVKMAGYWPSSFFCVFMDRDAVEVHKLAKKRTRSISSHLDRTNLVTKGFTIWLLGKFFLQGTAGSPERAR